MVSLECTYSNSMEELEAVKARVIWLIIELGWISLVSLLWIVFVSILEVVFAIFHGLIGSSLKISLFLAKYVCKLCTWGGKSIF